MGNNTKKIKQTELIKFHNIRVDNGIYHKDLMDKWFRANDIGRTENAYTALVKLTNCLYNDTPKKGCIVEYEEVLKNING